MITEMPFSRESEEALLGGLLIRPEYLNTISLSPEEFFIVRHQMVYESMLRLGANCDYVALIEDLRSRGKLDEVGGQQFITSLPNLCPNSYNLEIHENIIRDKASRRKMLEIASDLARKAYDEESEISDTVSSVVTNLVTTARPVGGAVHIKSFLQDLHEEVLERSKNPRDIYGLATGLHDFDKITHGLQKGEQIILSGAPGTGKSLLGFQLACGMAENGYPGVVYELEMKGIAVMRRRVSALSKIKTYNMLSGKEMNEYWDAFIRAAEKMEKLPIYLSQETNWTTMQIRADISRLKQKYGIDWFMIDYMEKLNDPGDRDERMGRISKNLSDIAKDLDVAGLTLQSVVKSGFGKSRGEMGDISGPHNVAHDADQLLIMTKGTVDNPSDNDLRTITWDKIRESDTDGILTLYKVPGFPHFECVERHVEEKEQWWQK